MFKLDGSQTSWLVYADWLEDQGIPASYIRELAKEEITQTWIYEVKVRSFSAPVKVGAGCIQVGSGTGEGQFVGSDEPVFDEVFDFYEARWQGDMVGGQT